MARPADWGGMVRRLRSSGVIHSSIGGIRSRQVGMVCPLPGTTWSWTLGCRASSSRWKARDARSPVASRAPTPSQNRGIEALTGRLTTRSRGVLTRRACASPPNGSIFRGGLPTWSLSGVK
jgi:hypothetical protein